MVKIPTQWFTPNRNGTVSVGFNNFLVTNSGAFIVTNSGDFLVTNTLIPVKEPATSWTQSVKNASAWIPIGEIIGTVFSIADPVGNLLVDPQSNQVVDTGITINTKPATGWAQI